MNLFFSKMFRVAVVGAFFALAPMVFAQPPEATTADVDGAAAPSAEPSREEWSFDSLRVGFGGHWKAGFWTELSVTVYGGTLGQEYELEIGSLDSDRTPTVFSREFLARAEGASVVSLFQTGKADAELSLSVRDPRSKEIVVQKSFRPIKPRIRNGEFFDTRKPNDPLFYTPESGSRPLWLMVGDRSNGLAEMLVAEFPEESRRPLVLNVERFSDLPTEERGYDAAEILILTFSKDELYESYAAKPERFEALRKWVRFGGRLILTGGEKATRWFASGGPLADFLPGTISEESAREIRIANELVRFVPKAKNLVMTGTLDSPYLRVPVLRPSDDAIIDLAESDVPILVRRIEGFGSVLYFAGDLSAVPLAGWNGRTGLWLKILGYDADRIALARTDSALVQLGYDDLSGQMRSALDRFDNVRRFPFSLILILIALYALLIGPADWFLTHRVFRRPNLTWVTFPFWIALFSFLALAIQHGREPNEICIEQTDCVDWDMVSRSVRGASWIGFYSPADSRYDMELIPRLPNESADGYEPQVWFSPLGLAGSGLGGMEQKTVSAVYWDRPYRVVGERGHLEDLPIQVRSSKSLFGRWSASASLAAVGRLSDYDSGPVGTVINPFDVPIQNAILYYGKWAIPVGELAAGATFTINRRTQKVNSQRVLGGAADPFNTGRTNTMLQSGLDRYDTMSTDPEYILRAMMFHRMAGGAAAVGLTNVQHAFLDASELMRSGRAVLTGSVVSGEKVSPIRAELSVDSAGERHVSDRVFVRLFLPVDMNETSNAPASVRTE